MRLGEYDAVLFDMDGTLVDTEPLWFEAEQAVAERFGVTLPESALDELLGLDTAALVGVLQERYGMRAEGEVFLETLGREVFARLDEAPARPGAEALVKRVAALGKARAIVSNSSAEVVAATLRPHAWAALVPRRFSVDEVSCGKPAPDLYLHAAASLGVPSERCVAVEDSITGVRAAVRAGLRCVAVTFGERPDEAFAPLTPWRVASLDEACRLLI
jgi:HAD superfamily hydrolase (TIGR01509 family)